MILNSKYQNLFITIKEKILGRNADLNLKNKLNNIRHIFNDADCEKKKFFNKFNKLYNMADNKLHDMDVSIAS